MTQAQQHELGWDRLTLRSGAGAGPRGAQPWAAWSLAVIAFVLLLLLALFAGVAKVRPDDIGVADGDRDAVSVEVLDQSAFDARFGAKAAAEPAPAAPPQAPAPPPSPAAQVPPPDVPPEPAPDASAPAAATPLAPPPAAVATLPTLPPTLQAGKSGAGTQAAGTPKLDLSIPQSALAAASKPMTASELVNKQLAAASPRAKAGDTDAWAHAVTRILDQSKPRWKGAAGQTIAEFTVGTSGEIQNLHLAQSCGKPELDDVVLASLRGLHFPSPPPGASLQDRTFDVTYY